MKDLIIACYRELLGRGDALPSAAEIDHWLVKAARNGWTAKQLADRFVAEDAAGKK